MNFLAILVSIMCALFALVSIYAMVFHRKYDKLEIALRDETKKMSNKLKQIEKKIESKRHSDINHFEEILQQKIHMIDVVKNLVDDAVPNDKKRKLMIGKLITRKEEMIHKIRWMELTSGSIQKQKNALKYYCESKSLNDDICYQMKLLSSQKQIFNDNYFLYNQIIQICINEFNSKPYRINLKG